eukprot:62961_1
MCSTFAQRKLPISLQGKRITKPSYHPDNKKCIILSTDYEEFQTNPGIYKYNMETNEIQQIGTYNNETQPSLNGQLINPHNNTLILYGGLNATFVMFDIKTHKFKTIKNPTNKITELKWEPQHAFDQLQNIFHILSDVSEHFTYSGFDNERSTMPLDLSHPHYIASSLFTCHVLYPKIVYANDNLYVFGHKNIFMYKNLRWRIINTLKMPA